MQLKFSLRSGKMKSLKFLRLSGLEPNTFVKIVYGKDRKFSGYVAENDGKKSLEIINTKGELLVISYNEIMSFIIKNKAKPIKITGKFKKITLADEYVIEYDHNNQNVSSPSAKSEKISEPNNTENNEKENISEDKDKTEPELNPDDNESNDYNDEKTETDEKTEKVTEICEPEPESKPDNHQEEKNNLEIKRRIDEALAFFDNKIYAKIPEIGNDYIINLHQCLSDDLKNVITPYFNNFMSHDKNQDKQKCLEAVNELEKDYDEYKNDETALKLLAYMYAYAGDYEKAREVFKELNDYYNISVYSYICEDYETSLINAYLCLKNKAEAEQKFSKQMIYNLVNSTVRNGNAYYFNDLVKKYPSFFPDDEHINLNICFDYLVYMKANELPVSESMNTTEILKYYISEKCDALVDISKFPPDTMFGYVFNVDKLTCTVCSYSNPGKQYTFLRNLLDDKKNQSSLKSKLADSEQDFTKINVSFNSYDGQKATNVEEITLNADAMISLGSQYVVHKEYKSALDCFYCTLIRDNKLEEMFPRIIQCYMTLANFEHETQNYKSAKKFIDKYGSYINNKYSVTEAYYSLYVRMNDSEQITRYFELLIENAPSVNKKLHYLVTKAEYLFKDKKYSEAKQTLEQWLDVKNKITDTALISKYSVVEKDKINLLIEKCVSNITQPEKVLEKVDDNQKNVSDNKEETDKKETSKTEKKEVVLQNVKSPEKKSSSPLPLPEESQFLEPASQRIEPEHFPEISYHIEIHPDKERLLAKNKFSHEFKRQFPKQRQNNSVIVEFLNILTAIKFFSLKMIKHMLDATLREAGEKDYTTIDFAIDFFYSFGIIEKVNIDDDDDDYYYVTQSAVDYLGKDVIKKTIGKNQKIATFESEDFKKISLYLKHCSVILDIFTAHDKKYFITEMATHMSDYFKMDFILLKNKKIIKKGKADCGVVIISPYMLNEFDSGLYQSSLKSIKEFLKNKTENSLKSKDKIAVIVSSDNYGFEWNTVLSDALSSFIEYESFYVLQGENSYQDANLSNLTSKDIMNILFSDEDPATPPDDNNPETPDDSPEDSEESVTDEIQNEKTETPVEEPEPETEPDTESDLISESEYEDEQDIFEEEPQESEKYHNFMNDSSKIDFSDEQIKNDVSDMLSTGKYYCALTYLNAVSEIDGKYKDFYHLLSLAVDNPAEQYSYTSSEVLGIHPTELIFDKELYDACITASELRTIYYKGDKFDFLIGNCANNIKESAFAERYPAIKSLVDIFLEFRNKFSIGIDYFSDYSTKDRLNYKNQIEELNVQANNYYNVYADSSEAYQSPVVKKYIKIMFAKGNKLISMLKAVVDNDSEKFDEVREFLIQYFIKEKSEIKSSNITGEKIDDYIKKIWNDAKEEIRNDKNKKKRGKIANSSDKPLGEVENHSKVALKKISEVLCDWVTLVEKNRKFSSSEAELNEYDNKKSEILELLTELKKDTEGFTNLSDRIMNKVFDDIYRRINGTYDTEENKYYFIDFLKNGYILLDEYGVPEISSAFYSLSGFNIIERIRNHFLEAEKSFEKRLDEIFSKEIENNDYGSAVFINDYLSHMKKSQNINPYIEKISAFCDSSKQKAFSIHKDFIENIELVYNCGQLYGDDSLKEVISEISDIWYRKCCITHNYGFYAKIIMNLKKMIYNESEKRSIELKERLDILKNSRDISSQNIERINSAIDSLNYTVAEDYINLITDGKEIFDMDNVYNSTNYLKDFWSHYSEIYSKCTGHKIDSVDILNRFGKDKENGKELLSYWFPKGESGGEDVVEKFINQLGFENFKATGKKRAGKDTEKFSMVFVEPENAESPKTKIYRHPMAVFGSQAEKSGFDVVFISGNKNSDELLEKLHCIEKQIENISSSIVFLDYALTAPDRRCLAKKMKEGTFANVFAIVDRVVIAYLAGNYSAENINNMLMELVMPFSDFHPYHCRDKELCIYEEMFVGRDSQLDSLKSLSGANVLIGGHQTGKTSILRKIQKEIGNTAVFVDIFTCNVQEASEKIAYEWTSLYNSDGDSDEILHYDNWNDLCGAIRNFVENSSDAVYLILDNADVFIKECKESGFEPLRLLKDIQDNSENKFKFIISCLREFESDIENLSACSVEFFSAEEGIKFITEPLRYMGMYFENFETISFILANSNYYPSIICYYCIMLLASLKLEDYGGYNELTSPPYIITDKQVKKILSHESFKDQINQTFEKILKSDEFCKNNYFIIALIIAQLSYNQKSQSGYTTEEIRQEAVRSCINKISDMSAEELLKSLDELSVLGILIKTEENRYKFRRDSFCTIFGTRKDIEDTLINYIE